MEQIESLFRVPYQADQGEGNRAGVVHIKACDPNEAERLALEQVKSKYGENWKIDAGETSLANFADIWRDQPNEELCNTISAEGSESSFYERRAAARILARRSYEPAGEILLRWLNNPREGIGNFCYGYEHSAAHNEPEDHLSANDAEPFQVQNLATESLGLMRYEPARRDLQKILETDGITRECSGYYPGDEGMKKRIEEARKIMQLALARFDNPNMPETDLEDDTLLYIAAASPNRFFRTSLFKAMAKHVMESSPDYWISSSTQLAERYIEALRRLPGLEIPVMEICEDKLSAEYRKYPHMSGIATDVFQIPKIDLTSFLARQGMNLDIEKLERVCAEILGLTRNGEYLHSGSSVYSNVTLFDGTTVLVNDGLRKGIREYLERNHLFFHGGVIG